MGVGREWGERQTVIVTGVTTPRSILHESLTDDITSDDITSDDVTSDDITTNDITSNELMISLNHTRIPTS